MATSERFVSQSVDHGNFHESFYPFSTFNDKRNLYEIIKIAFLTFTLLPIRVMVQFFTLIYGYIVCLILIKTNNKDSTITSPLPIWKIHLLKSVRYGVNIILWCYGIHHINRKYITYKEMRDKYGYKNPELPQNQQCRTIVSNHISFMDIAAFMYLFGASFVAKEEIANAPIIGTIARCIDTLFLKQGKSLTQQIKDKVDLMNNHQCKNGEQCLLCIFPNMAVFPEGTTTNGRSLIAFRSGIFYASNKYPVRPIAIYSNNKCIDFSFLIHGLSLAFKLMTQFCNDVNIVIAEPYVPNQEEMDNPLLYAKNVNILISKMLGDVPIYLLNKDHKIKCYFEYLKAKMVDNINKEQIKLIKQTAKDILNGDRTLQFYANHNKEM